MYLKKLIIFKNIY